MAQVASELISITNNQKLADSKYIKDEALENKKQSDINKDSLAGGVYNVTKLHQLQSGYYTITTAIAAIPLTLRCVGMVITYQTASDSWETKQFKGILSDWTDSSKWEDFGGGGNNNGSGDGVYNISAANDNTKYATLPQALSAITDDSVKKGGMTVKYIDSNNGRYKTYHLTTQNWSNQEVDWIEDIPTGVFDKINLSEYTEIKGSIDGGGTINTGGSGKHIRVPVDASKKYKLSVSGYGGWYVWFTSDNATASMLLFSEPNKGRVFLNTGQSILLTVPDGATRLGLVIIDYNGHVSDFSLESYQEQGLDILQEEIDSIKNTDAAPVENSKKFVNSGGIYKAIEDSKQIIDAIDVANLTEKTGAPNDINAVSNPGQWWSSGEKGRHKAIKIENDVVYEITPDKYMYYSWVTSAYNPNSTSYSGNVPYANGGNRIGVSANISVILTPPAGAAYLILTTVDGVGNRATWTAKTRKAILGMLEKDATPTQGSSKAITSGGVYDAVAELEENKVSKYELVRNILLDSVEANEGSLVATTAQNNPGTYYYSAPKGGGYHKVIKVTPGYFYVLDKAPEVCAWLSSHTVPTANQQIAYLVGYDAMTLTANVKHEAPMGAEYLAFTVKNGQGVALNVPSAIKEYKSGLPSGGGSENVNTFVKFRVGHWNVGHYNYYKGRQGTHSPATIDATNHDMLLKEFRIAINNIGADILGICEDDPTFDSLGHTSINELYYIFEQRFQGSKSGFSCNSLYINGFKCVSTEEFEFETQYSDQHCYYKVVTCIIGGRTVKVVEVHFTAQHSLIIQQATELANAFDDDDYVILIGDINSLITEDRIATTLLDPSKGFTPANGGYVSYNTFQEAPGTNQTMDTSRRYAIDNIFVKGFNIVQFGVFDNFLGMDGLSDHCPIWADLTFKEYE